MFILIYILILTNIFIGNSSIINRIIKRNLYNSSLTDTEFLNVNGSKPETNNETMSSKVILFSILKRNPNLKANVFDKMLSDEMLSIKQHIHEKDVTFKSSVHFSTKIIVPTPTLELNQKWPIDKLLPQLERKSILDTHGNDTANTRNNHVKNAKTVDISMVNHPYDSSMQQLIENKIVGVRSFSRNTGHNHATKQCSCMKTNPYTTCTFKCSASVYEDYSKLCSHTDSADSVSYHYPLCTRTTLISYQYYVNAQPFFLGLTTDPTQSYYHPDIVNELKLPKYKHRKTTRPHFTIYYDNDSKYERDDEYKDTETPEKHDDVILVDDDVDSNDNEINGGTIKQSHKIEKGFVKVKDREKLIQDVVDDLKYYYSDAVIKDCYCSSIAPALITNRYIIYVYSIIILAY